MAWYATKVNQTAESGASLARREAKARQTQAAFMGIRAATGLAAPRAKSAPSTAVTKE